MTIADCLPFALSYPIVITESPVCTAQRWFLSDSKFYFSFHFSKLYMSAWISRHIILIFNSNYGKKWTIKKLLLNFFRGQRCSKKTKFVGHYSSNETDKIQFFTGIFLLSRTTFWEFLENLSSCYHTAKNCWNKYFWSSKFPASLFNDQFMHYCHFWLRLTRHILIFLFTCVNIRADSEEISAELVQLAAEYPMFQSWRNQR